MSNIYEHLKSHTEKSIHTGRETAELVVSQIDRASKQAIEHAKQHAEFTKTHLDAALDLREITNIFQFFHNQVGATTQYLTEVGFESHDLVEVFKQEFKELTNKHFDDNHTQINNWITESLQKTPVGSELMLSMTKHAMELANTTITEIRSHVNQTSNVITECMNHAKNQFSKPKATARSSRAKAK